MISVHGAEGQTPVVYVGGLDEALAAAVRQKLQEASFDIQEHPRMRGAATSNICNRGGSGRGVQLELTMASRETLFKSMTKAGRREQTHRFDAFVAAVRVTVGLE